MNTAQTNSEDFSIPFGLVGAPEIEQFVGRRKELTEIKEALHGDGSQRKIVVLHGLGGMGKTQVAVQFVKEYRDTYSAAFWLDGKDEDTLKKSFAGMATRLHREFPSSVTLKTAAEEQDANRVTEIIKGWLSTKGNTRWIMIFDNIDNPKLPGVSDPQAYDIRSYFPDAHQGCILVTTRSSGLQIGKLIPLRKFTDVQESIKVLTSTSGRKISDQGITGVTIITLT